MRELEGYREAMKNLPEEIREAEAEAEKAVRTEAVVSGGVSKGMMFSEKTELYVRATGEKTGMVYTEKLSEDPMETIWQAYENSREGEGAEIMNSPEKLQAVVTNQGDFTEVSAGELHAFAKNLETELCAGYAYAGSISVRAVQVLSTMGLVNSKGVDVWGTTNRFDVTVKVSYRENPMLCYEETVTAGALLEIQASYFVEKLHLWELSIRPQGSFKPGVYRAVLSSQAVNFLLVTGWKLFAANTYLSGGNPLTGRLGEKIFSDCISIRDYKEKGYPFLLDAEGTPSRDVTLVENGVFKGLMQNLSTAEQCGVPSSGNAGRKALLSGNIHTDMTIVPRNFTMESGEADFAALLEQCGDGIYIYESYDQFHSLNTVSGDFSFPCKGVLVEAGQLTDQVAGLTMNGNILELFKQVELLGKDQQIGPMAMYENYLVTGPAMLVKELRISG